MIKGVMRDNIRKYKLNQHQSKNVQSQSPPQRKLLKKLENTYKENTNKYEFSLQDNYIPPEQKEEAQDFRVEIERRYQKSLPNKVYVFPLLEYDNDNSDSETDKDESFSSLRHVTIYDLATQNQPRRHTNRTIQKSNTVDIHYNHEQNGFNSASSQRENIERDYSDWDFEDDDTSIPIEARIRDKRSATYKRLIYLLENTAMFSHNSTNTHNKQENEHNQYDYEENDRSDSKRVNVAKPYMAHNAHNGKADIVTNFTTQISTTDTQKGYNLTDVSTDKHKSAERNIKSAGRNENPHSGKKAQSHDKAAHKFNETSSSFMDKSLSGSYTGNSTSKGPYIETVKLTQDSLKRLYNANYNMLKSVTPQYAPTKTNVNMFSREGMFKSYNNERAQTSLGSSHNTQTISNVHGRNPMESLYQRAQNEVIGTKLRMNTTSSNKSENPIIVKSHTAKHSKDGNNQSSTTVSSAMTPLKREETPKDFSKKFAFMNFYGSPDQPVERLTTMNLSNTQSKLSKKNSVKALHIISPMKKTGASEKPFYMSYDFSQSKVLKKPAFKLDLTKRSQGLGRDTLSSTRTRNKTADKNSLESANTILMRTSYDTNNLNYNSLLNISSQKNASKTNTSNINSSGNIAQGMAPSSSSRAEGGGSNKNNSLSRTSYGAKFTVQNK